MTKPNLLFPTPVWTMQLDNYKFINEEMYNFIKFEQNEKDKVGINKSNVKGWHSKDFDLEMIKNLKNLFLLFYHQLNK